MVQQLVENTWNPIKVGGNSVGNGYSINSYAVSSSWYNRALDTGGVRISKLRKYYQAECDSVEISRALDILAEDISSSNADNEDIFSIEYPDDAKIKKTVIKNNQLILDVWNERTNMEKRLFERVREALMYGASFYRERSDGSVINLYPERMVGYILDENDESKVTHYIYDKTVPRIDQENSSIIDNKMRSNNSNDKYEVIPVENLIIFKVGDGPFGRSIIEKVYKTYRQLSLLEDAVVIYRVVRASSRLAFYIDVGNLQGPKREQAIERQRLKLTQKTLNQRGKQSSDFDPWQTSENFFLPTNSNGKGSRVESLPGGQSLGELRDVEWFEKKMRDGLRIPNSMVDTEQQGQFSDMRVGQIYQAEFRYMGHVKRLTRKFQDELERHFRQFASVRGFVIPKEASLKINDSMSFALYKDIEVNQSLLNVFQSTSQVDSMSRKFSMIKYLNYDQEDLKNNEYMMLKQKGLKDEVIKTMKDWEVEAIVYGSSTDELNEKYGLGGDSGGRSW